MLDSVLFLYFGLDQVEGDVSEFFCFPEFIQLILFDSVDLGIQNFVELVNVRHILVIQASEGESVLGAVRHNVALEYQLLHL